MKKTFILAAAALMTMVGCNKELIESPIADSDYGYINFGISSEIDMTVTKAGTTPQWNDYSVTLTKKGVSDPVWSKQFNAIDDADKKVPSGEYTVSIENVSATNAYSGMGQIRIGAEDTQTVSIGATSTFDLDCVPLNSKISFVYTEAFANAFDEANAKVTLGSTGRNLVMSMEQAKSNTSEYTTLSQAYFEPATSISWTLNATNAGGVAKTYSSNTDIVTVKGQWTIVKFDCDSTNGQLSFDITVSTDFVSSTIDKNVDPLQ